MIGTASPPDCTSDILKVTCAFSFSSVLWYVSFIRYKPVVLSSVSPNADSKASTTSSGSQRFGSVESMKMLMELESSVAEFDPL